MTGLKRGTADTSKICKFTCTHSLLSLIGVFLWTRPTQYYNPEFADKFAGFSMSTGKKWTLKMSKDDETTPGPAYDTQYLGSITKKVEMTEELKNGSFGAFKERQRQIPYKGFEKAYLGSYSPGPSAYNSSTMSRV